jgi:hypothetical protein
MLKPGDLQLLHPCDNRTQMIAPGHRPFDWLCRTVIDAGNTAPVPVHVPKHGLDHVGHDSELVVHHS